MGGPRGIASADLLEKAQILARIEQEKYINADGRWVDPVGAVLDVMTRNATPKLAGDRPNLIVVADDLFVSPVGNPLLRPKTESAFSSDRALDRVGGVLLLDPQSYDGTILYRCDFIENSACLPACALPLQASKALQQVAVESAKAYQAILHRWSGQ